MYGSIQELFKTASIIQDPFRNHRIFFLDVSLRKIFQVQDIFLLKELTESFAREPECDPELPARDKDMAIYITRDRAKTISKFQLVNSMKIWPSIV